VGGGERLRGASLQGRSGGLDCSHRKRETAGTKIEKNSSRSSPAMGAIESRDKIYSVSGWRRGEGRAAWKRWKEGLKPGV
jgi:hypothetical protein